MPHSQPLKQMIITRAAEESCRLPQITNVPVPISHRKFRVFDRALGCCRPSTPELSRNLDTRLTSASEALMECPLEDLIKFWLCSRCTMVKSGKILGWRQSHEGEIKGQCEANTELGGREVTSNVNKVQDITD